MLRILRDDTASDRVLLVLQGRIVADWAMVLERECLALGGSGLPIVLDFSGVAFIDCYGFEVLGRLGRAGVRIVACSPLIADMLEQEGIEVVRNNEDAADGKAPRMRGGLPDA